MGDLRVVIAGAGAAGVAIAKILTDAGVANIVGADRQGAIHHGRDDLNEAKRWFAENTNPEQLTGSLSRRAARRRRVHRRERSRAHRGRRPAQDGARADRVRHGQPRAGDPARGRPTGLAAVMATGRSDFPNQINNVLAFPGIFRGALDAGATTITEDMKVAAADAIAAVGSRERAAAPTTSCRRCSTRRSLHEWPQRSPRVPVVDGVCRPQA